MATYLDLETTKSHLNVDSTEDDAYISILLDVVENTVEIEIGEPLADLEDEGQLPARLIQAMEILVAHFYLIREPVAVGVSIISIPLTFDFLIAPFRNYTIQ